MASCDSDSPSMLSFDARHNQVQSNGSRRMRPPNIQISAEPWDRVPLRADKLSRRESRLGLRNIFGRMKTSRDTLETLGKCDENSSAERGSPSLFASSYNRPYATNSRPAMALSTPEIQTGAPAMAKSSTNLEISRHDRSSTSSDRNSLQAAPVKSSRGDLATWDPPPLFQAYPQASKFARLPGPVLAADAILRRGTRFQNPDKPHLAPNIANDQTSDVAADNKVRKKHRRDPTSLAKLEWTFKIFVLCTSGYLLQYSAAGHFDRLPEKMLHLSKDSAVYVSDALPGRHWVLQVSSTYESDGKATAEPRSLLSLFNFRGPEKRSASNLLLVFEGADEMESWLATLRREIEALGGKTGTTETGKPRPAESVRQLRAQPSQRTLVLRDPDRFSRVMPQSPPLSQGGCSQRESEYADSSATIVESDDATTEQSVDDVSTTNSIASNDGRQLDSLRESANRLSYMSSGRRTVVTSSSSSPACSPARNSFSVPEEEFGSRGTPHSGLRANAPVNSERRQSTQATNLADLLDSSHIPKPDAVVSDMSMEYSTPNFSVPISKRYSQMKLAHGSSNFSETDLTCLREETAPRATRKSPPTALSLARPLSTVADEPSPEQSNTKIESCAAEDTLWTTAPSPCKSSHHERQQHPAQLSFSPRRSSLFYHGQDKPAGTDISPRKSKSMRTLRNSDEAKESVADAPIVAIPIDIPLALGSEVSEERDRHRLSQEEHQENISLSFTGAKNRAERRSSIQVGPTSVSQWKRSSRFPVRPTSTADFMIKVDIEKSDPPSRSPPAPPHAGFTSRSGSLSASTAKPLRSKTDLAGQTNAGSKVLLNRRSMPQLAEGPPPAPPPTCALPPIPKKLSSVT